MNRSPNATSLISIAAAVLTLGWSMQAQNAPPAAQEKAMTSHATGSFDVKLVPQTDEKADETLGRMTIEKQIHGDLEGSSKGQMLTAMTATKGSAGYVAVERVTGTLKGRSGSFTLQHSATMDRNTPHLLITVVPDSGTGQLEGITGTFNIKITEGKHFYDFEYTLP